MPQRNICLKIMTGIWILVVLPCFAVEGDKVQPIVVASEGNILCSYDCENKGVFNFWTSYGKPYHINYKGLTEERAFSGKKSFKLDVTFSEAGRYIWSLPISVPPEGTILSGHMLVGEKSQANVSLGVSFAFPPTPYGGFTYRAHSYKTIHNKWVDVTLGNFARYGNSMADLMLHNYTGYLHRENICPMLKRIIIDVGAKAGDRLVVYIDDIALKNNMPKTLNPQKLIRKVSLPAIQRCEKEIKRLEMRLAKAKNTLARTKWTGNTASVKKALDLKINEVEKSLLEIKGRDPLIFDIWQHSRLVNQISQITNTVGNLAQL